MSISFRMRAAGGVAALVIWTSPLQAQTTAALQILSATVRDLKIGGARSTAIDTRIGADRP
jgi:hypothetical protein